MFNFFAYIRSKLDEKKEDFVELDLQQKQIEDTINQNDATRVKIGSTITIRENKLEYMQQVSTIVVTFL